jgi:hypothetical protein
MNSAFPTRELLAVVQLCGSVRWRSPSDPRKWCSVECNAISGEIDLTSRRSAQCRPRLLVQEPHPR